MERSCYRLQGDPSGNVRDCLRLDTDYASWYVDKQGDLRCDAIHHDGVNHYRYRAYRPRVTQEQMEALNDRIIGEIDYTAIKILNLHDLIFGIVPVIHLGTVRIALAGFVINCIVTIFNCQIMPDWRDRYEPYLFYAGSESQ